MAQVSVFNLTYEGTPPWDIGRPQPEIVKLAQAGEITGDVLDVGCGTGENALYLVSHGHEVWGIDAAPLAIEKAQGKAAQRGSTATFQVWDALDLERLGRSFDTVIDSGLFHTFSNEERRCFTQSLKSVLRSGGTYFMLCFSDLQEGHFGPRRVSQEEIRETFGPGWRVNYIREARFASMDSDDGARAWLASITRL